MTEVAGAHFAPRTLLFVPGDRAGELLAKAEHSGADGVILDLEDAVPFAAKDSARLDCVSALAGTGRRVPVFVRVNGVGTEWFADDIAALHGVEIAGVMLPKCERSDDALTVARLLNPSVPDVIALVETPRGVLAAPSIASEPCVVGIAFGAVDFAAEMGIRRTRHGGELVHARSQLVLAARAAGAWALDSPCTEPHGRVQSRREAEMARGMGFTGKLVVHPDQIAPVHEAFAPTESELREARSVVEAFGVIRRGGSGVGTLDGELIERPMADAAQQVLDRARRHEEER